MNVRAKLPVVFFFVVLAVVPICFAGGDPGGTGIIGGVSTGEPVVKTPAPRKQRVFRVKSSAVHHHADGRRVVVREVEQPEDDKIVRKEVVKAKEPLEPSEDPVLKNTPAANPAMRVTGVSATIYGRGGSKLTRVTIRSGEGTWHGWSNIDFRHMAGLWGYRANGREYFFLLGNELAYADDGRLLTMGDARRAGCPRSLLPGGDTARAAFALDPGKENRTPLAREYFHDLHTLYRKERVLLADAFRKREQNRERRAKNPPPPKPKEPVTIRFWKRDLSKENAGRGAGQ